MRAKHIYITALVVIMLGQSELSVTNELADPTRPAHPATHSTSNRIGVTEGGWVLNSTLVSPDRRVAVINGTHRSEGETVGNATVLQIRKMDVVILVSGKRITLPLLPDIVNMPQ